jgi:hypothetical protein
VCGQLQTANLQEFFRRWSLPKRAPKVLVYEALATLNRDFEQVLRDLKLLEELRLFPGRWQRSFLKTWRATLEETSAWANFEVVEMLHEREEREAERLGLVELCVPAGQAFDDALRVARDIAASGPETVRLLKRNLGLHRGELQAELERNAAQASQGLRNRRVPRAHRALSAEPLRLTR